MKLIITPKIREKLANKEPPVSEEEIRQCFGNQTHRAVLDTREQHKTDPLTRWFVSETDHGRKLKIMYVPDPAGIFIKSAYNATEEVQRIYKERALPL
ncbi:MAG: hypothetical protein FDZ72_15810 [Betaproteobacteria bacterium]|nr:MAG: hypothetical protein FDZ72_15810 [Betaproteobacteria bacterium]